MYWKLPKIFICSTKKKKKIHPKFENFHIYPGRTANLCSPQIGLEILQKHKKYTIILNIFKFWGPISQSAPLHKWKSLKSRVFWFYFLFFIIVLKKSVKSIHINLTYLNPQVFIYNIQNVYYFYIYLQKKRYKLNILWNE